MQPPPGPPFRRRLLQAAAGAAWAAWQGSAAASSRDDRWRDDGRSRDIPWRLRLPEQPGPWPLVLYSHGLGGNREGGERWGTAWAAAGLAVLHMQHRGSDTDTLRGGLRLLRAAASAEQLRERVLDMRFVLDEVARLAAAGVAPWSAMRLDAIGVAGHSFGAHTTLALAGQRFPVRTEMLDPRPRAFIALSPSSPVAGRMSVQEAFGAITRPLMAVTGSLDGDPFGSYDSGQPRAAVYDGLPPGQRALLWLDGADHYSFGGGRGAGLGEWSLQPRPALARERQPAHQAVVAGLTTAWWRSHLLGDAVAREALVRAEGLGPQDRLTLG